MQKLVEIMQPRWKIVETMEWWANKTTNRKLLYESTQNNKQKSLCNQSFCVKISATTTYTNEN